MYGLQSDIYSIFDLISPTFQRISFAPIRNKTISSFSPSVIYPLSYTQDDLTYSSCLYQPYDDICIITSDTNSSLLSFPNITIKSIFSTKKFLTSTLTSYKLNSTDHYNIASIDTTDENRLKEKFNWQNISILIILILCGIILCIILSICCFIKYRRKDAGVYELEEAQRFRPLIVELPPSPGERKTKKKHTSKKKTSKKTNIKSKKKGKRKKTPLIRFDDQREFYI